MVRTERLSANHWALVLLFAAVLVSGCIQTLPSTDALPTATVKPNTVPTAVDAHVDADWSNVSSRTNDGLAMLGNPNAPVTFVDYSDFM